MLSRIFLLFTMSWFLLNPSFLFAADANSTQQLNNFYQQYMENVLDTLKCKADDDSCYQKAFEQASEGGECTPPTCNFACTAQCITAGSYTGGFSMLPHIREFCSSEQNQQICTEATIAFCKRLCNKN